MKSATIEPGYLQKRTNERCADGEDQAAVADRARRDLLTPAVERPAKRVRMVNHIRRLEDNFEVLRLPEDFIGENERSLVPTNLGNAPRALIRNDACAATIKVREQRQSG